MTTERYQQILRCVAKLRLRATSLLAESSDNAFEAAVLFHLAESHLRSARDLLAADDHLGRARVDIERCWCFLDGSDPKAAERLRKELDREFAKHPETSALLARLDVRQSEALRAFHAAISRTPLLFTAASQGRIPTDEREHLRAIREVEELLRSYPGTSGFWWIRYRLSAAARQPHAAWDSLERADRVDPSRSHVFRSFLLLLAPEVLPPDSAREFLDKIGDNITNESAEVCLYYAFAELKISPSERTSPELARARTATLVGESRTAHPRWKRFFRVTRRTIDARATGEPLTLAVLVEEGLADLIPSERRDESILLLLERASTPELEARLAA